MSVVHLSSTRVKVDDRWEVSIPKGFIYSTDKKVIGNHRDIIIMEDKKGNDFSEPFAASISFTSQELDGKGAGVILARQMFDMMCHGAKMVFYDNDRLFVAHSYEGRETLDNGNIEDLYLMYIGTREKVSSVKIFFHNSDLFVLDQAALVDKVANSIRPLIKKRFKGKDSLKQLTFTNGKEITVANRFIVPIPDGFHYSTDQSIISDQRIAAVFPESYGLSEEPTEAPYGLYVLPNEIGLGGQHFTEELSEFVEDMLTNQVPIFKKGQYIGKIIAREKLGMFYQLYFGNPGDNWDKMYAVIFANDKAYIISVIYNHPGIDGTDDKVYSYFLDISMDWLERIRLKGEKKPEPDDFDDEEEMEEGTRIYLESKDGSVSKLEKTENGLKKVASKKASGNLGDDIKELEKAAKKKTKEKTKGESLVSESGITDDVAKMYVLMDDYERVEPYKNKSDFIKAHDEYFPKMKKTDMGKIYADVKSNRKKKAFKEGCINLFMSKPVDYRFDITAKKCFHLSKEEDFRDRKDDALLMTRKWFRPEEEGEVLKLMDSMMESIKKDLLSQIEVGGDNWTRFYSAKPDLEIVITDCDRGNTEIPEINSLFQHVAYFENALVTVNLSKGGYFGYTAELANFMPWIWGVSALDIWNAAFKNEINDKRSLPFGSESTARVAYEITEKTVEIPQNDAKDLVSKIKKIYDDCTDVDAAKKKLEELDKDIESKWYKFDKVRLRALRLAKTQKFDLLVNVLEESETLKQFQKDLPKAIIKDIPIKQAAKALKRAKDDLDSAKQTITRSETSIREYQKEIENDKKALEEKRKELADFEEANGKELEDDKFRITTNQERQRAVVKTLETTIADLEKNIEDTQNELNNTSFFKFSLKKELTAKIEELNAKLKECKDKLPEENFKLNALNTEYNNKVLRNQQEIESMRRAIDQLSNRIRNNTSRIPTLEQLIEDKKKAIPALEDKVKELEKK